MEDFLKFLAIAGVIAFGIFRQFTKEKEKNAEDERTMPHSPSFPYEKEQTLKAEMLRQQTSKPKYKKQSLPNEGVRSTMTTSTISPPSQQEVEEADCSEFSIHSAEEARRAIIWSEILQRKY